MESVQKVVTLENIMILIVTPVGHVLQDAQAAPNGVVIIVKLDIICIIIPAFKVVQLVLT